MLWSSCEELCCSGDPWEGWLRGWSCRFKRCSDAWIGKEEETGKAGGATPSSQPWGSGVVCPVPGLRGSSPANPGEMGLPAGVGEREGTGGQTEQSPESPLSVFLPLQSDELQQHRRCWDSARARSASRHRAGGLSWMLPPPTTSWPCPRRRCGASTGSA